MSPQFEHSLIHSFLVMGALWTLDSSRRGWSLYSSLPMTYGTSLYAISLGVNLVLTVLIMARLLIYRRHVLKSMPSEHGSHYFSLATIIIESAAINLICSSSFLISYAMNEPINQVFISVANAGQVSTDTT